MKASVSQRSTIRIWNHASFQILLRSSGVSLGKRVKIGPGSSSGLLWERTTWVMDGFVADPEPAGPVGVRMEDIVRDETFRFVSLKTKEMVVESLPLGDYFRSISVFWDAL